MKNMCLKNNNVIKKAILNAIIDKWYGEKQEDGEILFYKHLKCDKQNKIYQIILSGTEYDGIYELYITKSQFKGTINGNEIIISNNGNLDYALFKGKEKIQGYLNPETCRAYGNCIIRSEYEDEKSFKNALLDTGFITEEDYEVYTFDKSKEYIYSKTPKIKFY